MKRLFHHTTKATTMKNITITLLLCFTISVTYSQLALRGGLNYSDVTIEGIDVMTESKVGFHAGLQGHLGVGTLLSIRPALLYNIKGTKVETSGASESKSLHYLEAPLDLAIKIGLSDLAVIIEGGPYIGYLVNTADGIFDKIDKTDWGINFGAVIELSTLGIGINYSNSLSEVEREDQINQAFKLKNGNLAAFVYFKF